MTAPSAPLAPTQAVTVVQPAQSPLTIDVSLIAGWAIAIVAIAGGIALLYKLLMRETNRDIAELRHKLNNTATKVEALEQARTADIERMVRMETSVQGFKDAVDRLERIVIERFEAVTESIREIRMVDHRR